MNKNNYHSCSYKKCAGNFEGVCRQPYLECYLHMTVGTQQQKALEEILKQEGKDFFVVYRKKLERMRGL